MTPCAAPTDSALADPGLRFAGANGERSPRISAADNFLSATFTREILDIDWVSGGGHGVTWDLPLEAHTEQDLFVALAELSAIEWAERPVTGHLSASATGMASAPRLWLMQSVPARSATQI